MEDYIESSLMLQYKKETNNNIVVIFDNYLESITWNNRGGSMAY